MLFSRKKSALVSQRDIYFYNTATRSKERFVPLKPGKPVTIYSCGPTVYDHIHIGNLRAYLLPDTIKRVLHFNGFDTKHTINFTDFGHLSDDGDEGEDKIMNGMKKAGLQPTLDNMYEFVVPFIESFKEDNQHFGNLPADFYARASDYVKAQRGLIETIELKGYAYETSDGVYFDVDKFPTYGALTGIDVNKIKAGARVETKSEKRHPADFALWKKSPLGWKSRWGFGFPGWHIECTAMAFATLGKQLDIHTGGEDLAHTHHNGEIAQAESVTKKPYVHYWLHNNFVTMRDHKMAKSTGNTMRLRDLKDLGYPPESYRYWLLQTHYRTTVNFTLGALDAAKTALTRLKKHVYIELGDQPFASTDDAYVARFHEAINDDLDFPRAIALLWELVKDESVKPDVKLATIRLFDSVLHIGLSRSTATGRTQLGEVKAGELPETVQALIAARDAARNAKDYATSDRLRDALIKEGYEVLDSADGTKVRKNS